MTDTTHRYKVPRVAARYGLADIGDELVARWTREDDPSSLRELATYFNERVTKAAMAGAGMDPLSGESENTYRLLVDDDVSSGVRTETRKKLERNGIDIDRLESDFVTYQAVRTYLKEVRDVSYERTTDEERVETVARSVSRLQNRTEAVTRDKLANLEQSDRMDLGDFRVLLELRVFCEECGSQYEVGELLERGGCKCNDATPK